VSGMDAVALRSAAILCGQKVFLFNDTIRNNFNEFRQAAEKGQMSDDDMKKYLSICHADRDLDKQCKNLSGGERARVFISICLSFRPKVLMLDEPTSSLDNDTAISVMKNIRSYCAENGMTLIAVSHDRSIIDAADNIITLGGKV
ncbi:MAG: ATP-binding cassette domain-containing protein, partial [Methanomassiliicoccaceae archaeon]|nr:ATP-binding cassette domain-containing protein [Methanomassiliicoccaceae archaeon]